MVTVQAWMGHASVATTNLYLHHLGTSADKAGLERLNRPGHTGAQIRQTSRNHMIVSRRGWVVAPGQLTLTLGGAKGTRTPDLLVANETRYRLRHSPADRGGPISTETLPPSGGGYLGRFAASVGPR